MDDTAPECPVGDVIITDALDLRPSRPPDFQAENRALSLLSEAMGRDPEAVLQRLTELAMELTQSHSAGISLLEPGGANGMFRWVATAGAWASYRDGVMPHAASPCGEVIARKAVLLLHEPHRAFPALLQADPAIREGLLAPFQIDEDARGTVWVIKHTPDAHFEKEDARLLASLARFAAVAHRMMKTLEKARAGERASRSALEREVTAMRALQRLTTDLVGKHAPAASYDRILRTAVELMDADAASLQVLDETENCLVLLASLNFDPASAAYWQLVSHDSSSACGRVLKTGKRVVMSDLKDVTRPEDREAFDRSGLVSCQSTPIRAADGRLLGNLSTHWQRPHTPDPEDFRYFDILVRLSGELVERTRAEAALRERESQFRSLFESIDEAVMVTEPAPLRPDGLRDWLYVAMNKRAQVMFGRLDLTGQSVRDNFPDEDEGWYDIYEHVFRTGEGTRFEREAVSQGMVLEMFVTRVETTSGAHNLMVVMQDVTERRRMTDALRVSEERQAFLLKLSDALRTVVDPAEIQQTAATLLGGQLGASRAFYFTAEQEDGAWFNVIERDYYRVANSPSLVGRYAFSAFGEASLAPLRRGEDVVIEDVHGHSGISSTEAQGYDALGASALVAVPILKGGRYVGGMSVQFDAPHAWAAAEVDLVRDTAERTWGALEQARAEAALRANEDQQQFLLALFDALAPLTASAEITKIAAARLCERLEVGRVHYGEIAGTRLTIEQDATRGIPSIAGEHDLKPFGSHFLEAYNPGAVIIVDNIERDPRLTDEARAWLRDRHVAAFADVVLFEESCAVSILAVQSATPRIWSAAESGLIREVGERLRSAVKRARAETALRESEARLREFGEASQDVLWIREAETLQWRYLTPAFETIYGLSREDALAGNNYRHWLDLIIPEDRQTARDSIERVRAGEHVAFEFRIRRPADGAIRWLRNTDFPILDNAGKVALIGGIGHDLTELRETELRLQALIEGIPQLVWTAGDVGSWNWASPQWTAFTGQPEAESRGRGWLEMLHPDDRDRADEAWSTAVEREGLDTEYRIRDRESGAYRWFQSRAVPVRGEAGDIVEWLGTSTDISDLRELQERQGVMVAELQHRTRNLITVVSAISHQTMEEAATLDDFQHRLDDRLAALSRVQGLLSHLSAGQRVAFDQLLGSELAAIGAPGTKVTLDGPAGVPLRSATVQTFSLALHELATNALKYGALASSGGHLTIRWTVMPQGDGSNHLQVDWHETGVDMTSRDGRLQSGGYGRELIEHALPYQMHATTTYELTPDGVHCTIDVPISADTMDRTQP